MILVSYRLSLYMKIMILCIAFSIQYVEFYFLLVSFTGGSLFYFRDDFFTPLITILIGCTFQSQALFWSSFNTGAIQLHLVFIFYYHAVNGTKFLLQHEIGLLDYEMMH